MKLLTLLCLGLLSLVFAGCQGGGATVRVSSGSQDFLDLQGGLLVLEKPLQVGAGRARVFIQDGRARVGYNVDEYDTQCNFDIFSIDHQGVAIEPDTFLISRVQLLWESIVLARPVQVASLQLAGFDGDADGVSASFMGYHFWLDSPRQPQVMRMTCHGTYAEPADLRPPTLQEIRDTLGDIARLQR